MSEHTESAAVLKRAKFIVGAHGSACSRCAVIVLVLRSLHAQALEASTTLHAKQYVTTVKAKLGAGGQPLTLPGTLQGIIESTVYARSNGYVAHWYKDIGASVKQGELLADIAAPEIDQELSQAEAARASRGQRQAGEKHGRPLAEPAPKRRGDATGLGRALERLQSSGSQPCAADANVGRLRKLQGFNRVVAPFDGVVTRRNVDVGDLVNAGNGGTGQALFSVAQVDPLRLYVYVPQVYATKSKSGDAVTVTLAERAGEQYRGTVARTAGAIDTATRTMQVEIRVPNPTGALIAGSYVQVSLPVNVDKEALVVPTNVLLFRPDGTRIAMVDSGGRVHLTAVKLGTDFGTNVEVLSGLNAGDRIVLNPADSLADGDVVTIPQAKAE